MPFSIKNPAADDLIRELTAMTGETLTEAVIVSLRQRLERERRRVMANGGDPLGEAIDRFRALRPTAIATDADAIAYDTDGAPS